MVGKQTMTWNGDANTKLLLAILEVTNAKPDFEAVAKQLTTDTITCTPRAVQEQLKKLRKLVANPGQATVTTPPATPRGKGSRKRAASPAAGVKKTRKVAAAGGKGKKGKSAAVDGDVAVNVPIKAENSSDEGKEGTSMAKKGDCEDTVDHSSELGGDFIGGSDVEDAVKAELGDEDAMA